MGREYDLFDIVSVATNNVIQVKETELTSELITLILDNDNLLAVKRESEELYGN